MIEKELYLFCLSLIVKEIVDILSKSNKIGFTHTHLHLSFINLSKIHHLVNQAENSFCITPDSLIDALSIRIGIVFDK